jgi:hypothetical protein
LKRVERVLNLDCGEAEVRFDKRLEHREHGVRDLVDDFAGILPDLRRNIQRKNKRVKSEGAARPE